MCCSGFEVLKSFFYFPLLIQGKKFPLFIQGNFLHFVGCVAVSTSGIVLMPWEQSAGPWLIQPSLSHCSQGLCDGGDHSIT